MEVDNPQAIFAAAPAADAEADVVGSEVAALMQLGLFQAALRNASPDAARALMHQLLTVRQQGELDAEAAADVALAYLALHTPRKLPRPPPPKRLQQAAPAAMSSGLPGAPQQVQQPVSPQHAAQQADGEQQQAEAAAAALDAVPPAMLSLILESTPPRCRRQLCALARRSPLLLGQLLSVSDPGPLVAEGLLGSADLLAALASAPGTLPAVASVAAAAALLSAAPPGPSPQLLHLVRIMAEGHQLLAIVESGHLSPAVLRAALEGASAATFTAIFKVRGGGVGGWGADGGGMDGCTKRGASCDGGTRRGADGTVAPAPTSPAPVRPPAGHVQQRRRRPVVCEAGDAAGDAAVRVL